MYFNIYKLDTQLNDTSEIISDFHRDLGFDPKEDCLHPTEDEKSISHPTEDEKSISNKTNYGDYSHFMIDRFRKMSLNENQSSEVWSFYSNKISDHSLEWEKNFLKLTGLTGSEIKKVKEKNVLSGGIFIRTVSTKASKDRPTKFNDFLITWGDAWRLADNRKIDNFGIRVTANLIEQDKILKLNAREISFNGRSISSRIIRPGRFNQFKINKRLESISKLVGEYEVSDNDIFPKGLKKIRLEGSSNLFMASKKFDSFETNDLINIVSKLNQYFDSKDYQKKHEFLDNIEKIPRESDLYNKIINKFIQGLKKGDFEYLIDIEDADTTIPENFKINDLNSLSSENFNHIRHEYKKIDGEDADLMLSSHIVAQLSCNKEEYLYFSRDIYKISTSTINYLDKGLDRISFNDNLITEEWKKSDCKEEKDYNKFVAKENHGFKSLDQVFYKFEYSTKYEICDLFSVDGHIVHVKKDDGPSSISHVCSQAFASILPLSLSEEVKQDYKKIFSLKALDRAKLNGEIVEKSYKNHRINKKFDKSKIDHNKYKVALCLALKDTTGDSRSDILKMSYLRKSILNLLCDQVLELGYELVVTTVKFSE